MRNRGAGDGSPAGVLGQSPKVFGVLGQSPKVFGVLGQSPKVLQRHQPRFV